MKNVVVQYIIRIPVIKKMIFAFTTKSPVTVLQIRFMLSTKNK